MSSFVLGLRQIMKKILLKIQIYILFYMYSTHGICQLKPILQKLLNNIQVKKKNLLNSLNFETWGRWSLILNLYYFS